MKFEAFIIMKDLKQSIFLYQITWEFGKAESYCAALIHFDLQVDSWRLVHQTNSNKMMDVKGERVLEDFISFPKHFFLKGGSGIIFILLYKMTSLKKSWCLDCITINNLDYSGMGQKSPKEIFGRA